MDSSETPKGAEKGRIEVGPIVSLVSDISYHGYIKGMTEFIEVIGRCNTSCEDIEANNVQVCVKKFDNGTSEDILVVWYIKYQNTGGYLTETW